LSSGRNVFEELGTGFTLLALDVDDRAVQAVQHAAASVHAPLHVIRDSFAAERTAYAARMVLVRPDQYVVWAADELPQDPAALLRKVVGTA
jgi:hypothetical protein